MRTVTTRFRGRR